MTYDNLPESVVFTTDTGVHNATRRGCVFEYSAVRLIYENGRVVIESPGIPLVNAILSWNSSVSDDALVYGDEWERSYATLGWRKPDESYPLPWYFMISEGDISRGYGVKVRPSAMCCWFLGKDKMSLVLDLRCGCDPVELGTRAVEVCTVVTIEEEKKPFYALRDFCSVMCDDPLLPKNPIYGGNDWYCCYGDSTYGKIIAHAKKIAECSPEGGNRPFMVVDAGWELCRMAYDGFNGGPWVANRKFGGFDAMKTLAEEVTSMGVKPGIWMRPLQTVEYTRSNYTYNSAGKFLDPSDDSALDYVSEQVSRICSWGFKLLKHDFSTYDITSKWGGEMGADMLGGCGHMKRRELTTAEIVKKLYEAIRKAAGDMEIIGCNVIGHLSAGIFHAQRIGDDTSGNEWERTVAMGVNTLAYRLPQHNTFFAADADCVGITKNVPWESNEQWLDLLSISGTPLFVSIAEDSYDDKVKEALSKAFKSAAIADGIAEPLDFTDAFSYERINGFSGAKNKCMVPSVWKEPNGKIHTYRWF